MGDGRIFLKSLRDASFNEDLWNESNLCRIHLAGQYLYRALGWTVQTSGTVVQIVYDGEGHAFVSSPRRRWKWSKDQLQYIRACPLSTIYLSFIFSGCFYKSACLEPKTRSKQQLHITYIPDGILYRCKMKCEIRNIQSRAFTGLQKGNSSSCLLKSLIFMKRCYQCYLPLYRQGPSPISQRPDPKKNMVYCILYGMDPMP